MRPLVTRELIAIARTPAFWVAAAAHVLALTTFVVVWGDGLPIHGGRPAFEQFLSVQAVLLAVVLPWTAIRCAAPAGASGITILAAASASPVSRVILARCIGIAMALALVALAGLPLATVVQQVSARPFAASLLSMVPLLGIAGLAAVTATGCAVGITSRLGAWMAATVVTLAVTLLW